MSTAELRTGSVCGREDVTSWQRFGRAYECPVLLCPEEEGGFSVHCLNLPGAISQGETYEDALQNIAEAISLLLEEYTEKKISIPWQSVEVEDAPKSAIKRWILVNV